MNTESLPDYLTIPGPTIPSFHCRVGRDHNDRQPQPANTYGYPVPGVQAPSSTSVMALDYFVSDQTWSNILAHGDFDYIVVGSGFTALAFIQKALELDPCAKILCLERGGFWLPSHFQNLPIPFKMVLGGPSETFPWTLSRKTFETKELKFCHGSCPFFGGRSTFWSSWSPQPSLDLMRDFPKAMKETAKKQKFWKEAKELLNVTRANQINDGIFGSLQTAIDNILKDSVHKIPTADYAETAPLAVGRRSPTSILRFNKFSVPGPLLGILEQQRQLAKANKGAPLEITVDCAVKNMVKGDDDNFVRVIETSKGTLSWTGNKTKIILCAGAIPNATMLLNSFESCRDTVGKRLTGHYDTHISARCPVKNIKGWKKEATLKMAAAYLAGKDPKTGLQYHVSVTAVNSPNPKYDAEDAARECPDYAAAATLDQLAGSEDYVVFVCSALGEFNEKNTKNHVTLNKGTDPTCNVTLQYTLSDEDRTAWDVMDKATYDTIKEMAGGDKYASSIEWWDEAAHGWSRTKPAVDTIRIPGIVHESSTCFMGPKDKGGSVDELYRPHGIENVHVTGAALFPTAGSWNPTMTMCGYAQDLAHRLYEMKSQESE
ncbi:FAD/NAD(P)-binding domain-containing protein [Fusarium redolens]|uniref:FAD/NAD(P)-binding domain-containing protein n=1 Tax=Fusarium redolens TaxID=48865 RepID=A0A9P9G3A8_FUSRE|nr:FAD/NAD(P)-binding domain-containing protein [Fusarium redolens]KAH7232309.1 FAD/NAD(P)-binding domain-containing protein [Fusarium redolens]